MKLDTVMLIDDNDVDIYISKRVIEMSNLTKAINVYSEAKQALEALKDLENVPDVIFLDISMPLVDGFMFLYEFEKFNEYVKNKCKIVVLSNHNNKKQIENIVGKGLVVKYVTKPLEPEVLIELSKI